MMTNSKSLKALPQHALNRLDKKTVDITYYENDGYLRWMHIYIIPNHF